MFSFTTIAQYHDQLRSDKTNCEDAVMHYLKMIRDKSHLNAFIEVFDEEALNLSRKLDKERRGGKGMKKLHGVIIAIKDVICFKDHKISAASAILENFTSLYTASALQYLIDEEAIIIGRCNCDEFAMGSTNENSFYGLVKNPWDESKVPGGSSGGSAVAVSVGMCMLSLGSDTGGSVRQPADFCGIIGMKPGYGRISRYGLIAYASSFDQIGIFGTTVPDVALLLEILSQSDEHDSTMDQEQGSSNSKNEKKKFTIGVLKEAMDHPSLDPEIRSSITKLTKNMAADGHQVDMVDFDLLDVIVPAYYVLTTAEASSNLSRYDGVRFGHRSEKQTPELATFYEQNRSEGFGIEVKRRIMLGTFVLSTGYYDAYFSKAQKIRQLLTVQMKKIFKTYDVIILPTSPVTAFDIGENNKDPISMYLADIYTVAANLTGLPAISVPLFSHTNNMPFGVQIMSGKGDELILLHIAEMLVTRYKEEKK